MMQQLHTICFSSSAQILSPPPHHSHTRITLHHHHHVSPSPTTTTTPVILSQQSNPKPLSRRDLAVGSASLLPLLLQARTATAAGDDDTPPNNPNGNSGCAAAAARTPTKKVFVDVSIDGEPAGRIVIGLYGSDAPVGSARFAALISGAAGITYRRKEFVKIMPSYIQHGGVRSYGVDADLAKRTGGGDLAVDRLIAEWESARENCPVATRNAAGSVGIMLRNPAKPPPKMKLVARKGKLEIDEEEVGNDPNGTEFVISTKDTPELDASVLVVGRVLEGMEVVEKISRVKTVQENTGSPYFRVAKLIGDKRAVVAERGFNRPYSKVIITNCGLID